MNSNTLSDNDFIFKPKIKEGFNFPKYTSYKESNTTFYEFDRNNNLCNKYYDTNNSNIINNKLETIIV